MSTCKSMQTDTVASIEADNTGATISTRIVDCTLTEVGSVVLMLFGNEDKEDRDQDCSCNQDDDDNEDSNEHR